MVKACSYLQTSITVVSGGASGIGKAIATQLAGRKALPANVAMPHEASDAEYSTCKVINPKEIAALYAPISETYGNPGILVRYARLGMQDFRVTTIAPGVTDTPFFKNIFSLKYKVESIRYGAWQQARHFSLQLLTAYPSLQPF